MTRGTAPLLAQSSIRALSVIRQAKPVVAALSLDDRKTIERYSDELNFCGDESEARDLIVQLIEAIKPMTCQFGSRIGTSMKVRTVSEELERLL